MSVDSRIPGNRVYPATSQHWTYDQRVAWRDTVRAAGWMTVALLVFVAVLQLIRTLWL